MRKRSLLLILSLSLFLSCDFNPLKSIKIEVTDLQLSPGSLSLQIGARQQLTATILPSDATDQSIAWTSSDPSRATVADGLVSAVASGGPVTISATTASGGKVATCVVTVSSAAPNSMRIGTNFWNIMWDGWTSYFKTGVNWSSATDPWNPQFLADLAAFNGPIRFMDFDATNDNAIQDWGDRIQKTDNHYDMANYAIGKKIPIASAIQKYYSSSENPGWIQSHWGIAYEWMIDLCNRTNHDLWVCVPTFSTPDYWTSLATLIRDQLKPGLKCYVEYSNETWNGAFRANAYTIDQGIANDLPAPRDTPSSPKNKWYQAAAWHVWHSLQVFKAFEDVFGAGASGSRLIRVLAFSGNFDGADKAYQDVMFNGAGSLDYNSTWNTVRQKADLLAIAPYIGPMDDAAGGSTVLDGAAGNIAARFRANVDWNYTHYVLPALAIAQKYAIPIGTYEGGQQLTTNSDQWARNPAIQAEYTYMLNKWIPAKFVMFNNYTLYGSYASGGAWGAKSHASATLADSPKFRALTEWLTTSH